PLPDEAADAIVVGQAFHWFDARVALREFHRVLRPGGRLGLVWNLRDRRQQLQQAIDEITEPLRGDTPSQSGGEWRGTLGRGDLFSSVGELEVPFGLELDADTFVNRIASISFIAALDDVRRDRLLEQVRTLAVEHPEP